MSETPMSPESGRPATAYEVFSAFPQLLSDAGAYIPERDDDADEQDETGGPVCTVCQSPPCHCLCFGKKPAPHCPHRAESGGVA